MKRRRKREERKKGRRKKKEEKKNTSPGIEPKTFRMEGHNSLAIDRPRLYTDIYHEFDCHELRVALLAALAPPTNH